MEELILNYPPLQYCAEFDPQTGSLVAVGPDHYFEGKSNILDIDQETAEMIMEGKIKIHSCFVDPVNNELEITETKNIFKIDNVLHRITEKKWSKVEKPEVYITYNSKKKQIKFELTEEFKGTKKLPKKFHPVKQRKINWDGDTEMSFMITDYNDPNLFFELISFKINDIVEKSKTVDIEVPETFSVYTRRIFKNYVFEYK